MEKVDLPERHLAIDQPARILRLSEVLLCLGNLPSRTLVLADHDKERRHAPDGIRITHDIADGTVQPLGLREMLHGPAKSLEHAVGIADATVRIGESDPVLEHAEELVRFLIVGERGIELARKAMRSAKPAQRIGNP